MLFLQLSVILENYYFENLKYYFYIVYIIVVMKTATGLEMSKTTCFIPAQNENIKNISKDVYERETPTFD